MRLLIGHGVVAEYRAEGDGRADVSTSSRTAGIAVRNVGVKESLVVSRIAEVVVLGVLISHDVC